MAQLIADILADTARVDVVGVCFDGLECIRLVEKLEPDAVFLDVRMDTIGGSEVAEACHRRSGGPITVMVTDFGTSGLGDATRCACDYVVEKADYATFAARLEAAVDWIEGAVGRRPHSSGSQGQEGAGAEVCVDWTQSRQGIASGQIILVEYGATQAVVHTGERTYITRHAIRGFVERLRAAGLVAAEPGVLIGPEEAEGRALAASGTSGFGAGGAGSRGSRRDKAASQVEGKTGGPEA